MSICLLSLISVTQLSLLKNTHELQLLFIDCHKASMLRHSDLDIMRKLSQSSSFFSTQWNSPVYYKQRKEWLVSKLISNVSLCLKVTLTLHLCKTSFAFGRTREYFVVHTNCFVFFRVAYDQMQFTKIWALLSSRKKCVLSTKGNT